jgi:hypothetical protein
MDTAANAGGKRKRNTSIVISQIMFCTEIRLLTNTTLVEGYVRFVVETLKNKK